MQAIAQKLIGQEGLTQEVYREDIDREAEFFVGDNKTLFWPAGYLPTFEEFYDKVEDLVAMTLHILDCQGQRIN